MIRFSLASLFGVTLFVAVGCVALMYANSVWRQGAVTLTVSVLLLATLLAIAKRGRARVFALGFAVSGWLYLLLAFSPALALRDDLLSENAIAWLFEAIHEEDVSQYYSPFAPGNRPAWIDVVPVNSDGTKFRDFADIGHALWTLVVGGVGGLTASVLWAKQQRSLQTNTGQHKNPPSKADE